MDGSPFEVKDCAVASVQIRLGGYTAAKLRVKQQNSGNIQQYQWFKNKVLFYPSDLMTYLVATIASYQGALRCDARTATPIVKSRSLNVRRWCKAPSLNFCFPILVKIVSERL
ncbi:hypothetical protein [uncultured Roseobacter sp.]|uniref:hypothetical protein n=1 Tax=uncultured Roseobacter sp. TaxID=114847 RepID=UPI00260CFA89|nr:hypothetical protein [uncultured Roseobacter sp.]